MVTALGATTALSFAPDEVPVQATVVEAIEPAAPLVGDSDDAVFRREERVLRGDTVASLLKRLDIDDAAFAEFVRRDATARALLSLKPGRSVSADVTGAGRVERLAVLSDAPSLNAPARRLVITRKGEAFRAVEETVKLVRSNEMRAFEIRSTLFSATDAAGVPDSVAGQLDDILGGDFDFNRDLQKGDRIRVVWESLRVADSLEAPVAGRVLAVELHSGSRTYSAAWFDRGAKGGDYYTFDGRSLRKSFLRSPLEVSRITSGFTNARLHPIHNEWRAHRGVDYGAPVGTRVRAVAEGTVDFAGWQGGYGNVVSIRHPNGYQTVYAHLNAIGSGIRKGSRVAQADTIGTVGSTGWSTGPHLHYELRINGMHVDPLKVALPQAQPLQPHERTLFMSQTEDPRRRLALLDTVRVARFE